MKIVIQRSKKSQVIVDQKIIGSISKGMVLLVCFEKGDDQSKIAKAVQKIVQIRLFEDDAKKMNLNIDQIDGDFLCISQFTLAWEGKGGHRPGFENALDPLTAEKYFSLFCQELSKQRKGREVQQGIFGADMLVQIENDGPVTFCLNF